VAQPAKPAAAKAKNMPPNRLKRCDVELIEVPP
jgi:hypothetical protein